MKIYIFTLFFSLSLFAQVFLEGFESVQLESQYQADKIPITISFSPSELEQYSDIEIILKEDIRLQVFRSEFKKENGFNTWIGKIKDDSFGSVIITYKSDSLSVNLSAGGHHYWLSKEHNQYYLIESRELEDKDDVNYPDPVSTTALVTQKSSDNFIDIMIVYTSAVAAFDSNIEATIQSRVSTINNYLKNSCVNFRYRLVHSQQLAYTENNDLETDLNALANGTGALGAALTLRETHGADLVQLITKPGSANACGIGNLNPSNSINDNRAFSVSNYNCGSLTMAHEFGHNIGLQHDIHVVQDDTNRKFYKDGLGFVDLINKKRSIMAYSDHCQEVGVSCPRIGHFSNPKTLNSGISFGVGEEANSSNYLNKYYGYIANFRPKRSNFSPNIDKNCVAEADNKDVHCFIATAAFGSYMHSEVLFLRNFRDKFLSKFSVGRWLIKQYYEISPKLAYLVQQSENFKFISQQIIKMITWTISNPFFLLLPFTFFFRRSIRIILIVSILGLSSIKSYADVAVPSMFSNIIGVNPATRFIVQAPVLASFDYKTATKKSEATGIKRKDVKTNMSLTFGMYNPAFFAEGTVFSKTTNNKSIDSDGIKTFNSSLETNEFRLQGGTNFSFINQIALKYHTIKTSDSEDFESSETQIIGLGKIGLFNGFRYGFGFDYLSQEGDSLAAAKWIETYIALAGGNYSGSAGYLFEYSFRRRPKVTVTSGDNSNYKPERWTHTFIYETADQKFPALFIDHVRFVLKLENEKALNPFIDEDISSTELGFALGGLITNFRTKYMFGYSMINYSDAASSKENKIDINFSWAI